MASRVYPQTDFGGSLNLRDAYAYDLTFNQNINSQNIVQSSKSISTLPGYTKFNPIPVSADKLKPVRSMFRYFKQSDETKITFAQIDDTMYQLDSGASEIVNTIGASATGFSTTFDAQWLRSPQGNDNAYFVDGTTDTLRKFNGSVFSDVTVTGITPTSISAHFNRAILSNGNTFYYSDAGDPESYDTTNQTQILPTTTGAQIIQHVFLDNTTYFFVENAIYAITGNISPFTIYEVSTSLGSPSPKGIIAYGSLIFFFGNDRHIYALQGNTIFNLTEKSIGQLDIAVTDYPNVVLGIDDQNRLMVFYNDQSSSIDRNNTFLLCDFTQIANPIWSGKHIIYPVNSLVRYDVKGDTGDIYFGDAYSSTVYKKESNIYYQGVGIENFINSSVTITATQFSITVSDDDITAFDLTSADALTGTIITIVDGAANGLQMTISSSTAASSNQVTVTLESSLTELPIAGNKFRIGEIDSRYQMPYNALGQPANVKTLDKLFITSPAQGDYTLSVKPFLDFRDGSLIHLFSLLGQSSLWDTAVWDINKWDTGNMITDYVDLGCQEFGKKISLEFRLRGINKQFTIHGIELLYNISDKRNTDAT